MTNLQDMPEVQEVLRPVTRWPSARKFWLLTAIRRGIITAEAACALHAIGAEEFDRWKALHDAHGQNGLKLTRIQRFRCSQ